MAKEKQESQQKAEVTRFAVAIHRGADGKWVVEDLRLLGNEVAQATTLTVVEASKGVRVVAGTFALMVDDRVQEWQREGLFK